jgi:hypothetical protein
MGRVFPTAHDAALDDWKRAQEIVARYYKVSVATLRRDFRVRLLNTRMGMEDVNRDSEAHIPEKPVSECEYGAIYHPEKAGGTHYIAVNPILWESGHDLLPTLIHELLHMIDPLEPEENIREKEREICQHENIEMDDMLG